MTSPQQTCPNDGQPLQQVDSTPSTPPWWCTSCSRLWWPVQLEPTARRMWKRDRGYPAGIALTWLQDTMAAQAQERRDAARQKGRR